MLTLAKRSRILVALLILSCSSLSCADSASNSSTLPSDSAPLSKASASLTPVNRIGAFRLPSDQVFGRIRDAALTGSGIAILAENTLYVFGDDSSLLASAGGFGDGPTEFQHATSLATSPNGLIYVADRTGKIVTFQYVQGSLVWKELIQVRQTIEDFCYMREHFYIQSPSLDTDFTIHEYDREGKPTMSFGIKVDSSWTIVRNIFSTGILECVGGPNPMVIEFLDKVGELRTYNINGIPQWATPLQDFTPVKTELVGVQGGREGIRYIDRDEGFDVGASLVPLGDTAVLVQVQNWQEVDGDLTPVTTRSYGFRLDGQIIFQSRKQWPLLFRLTRRRAFAFKQRPYPQVIEYQRESVYE